MKKYKKSMLKRIFIPLFCMVMLSTTLCVSAVTTTSQQGDIPHDSYTYWETSEGFKAVYTKPLFDNPEVISANTLGIADFRNLIDVSVAEDGYVFLLDSEQSRVVILTPEYKLYREITSIGGESFAGAKGILAYNNGNFYIADTENARVLISDRDGNLVNTMLLPKSSLIPEDFNFRPLKLTVDRNGYTYVLSEGSYYGAILYSPEGEFLSFYGSNTIETGIGQALTKLWENLTMTNEKRAQQVSKLPYQFTDLYVDKNNFIYTATGKTGNSKLQTGVIKMLSPGGTNILPSADVAFGEKFIAKSGNANFNISTQDMAGLAVDDYEFIYTYDTSFSRIYLYDSDCNMICAFGGGFNYGQQTGTFQLITAIDVSGDDVLVTDGSKNTLTLFRCNEYGKKLKALQRKTLDGDYLNAKPGWQEIRTEDSNNRFAYIGLAKAAYTEGDYDTAKELSEQAYDKHTYALAFEQLRKEWLSDNFGWLFTVALLAVAGIWIGLRFLKKRKTSGIKDVNTKLFLSAMFHPAAVFTEIKQKKLTSGKWCVIALLVYYVSVATQQMFASFMFVTSDAGSFNSVMLLLKTVGLVGLWTIANWGVCTLLGGIGKTKEILTVVCYSLMPMIIGNFAYTILTHILVPEEAAFLTVIMTALQIYTIIMITIGTIIIHDFSFGRFVGTSLLTIFGIAVVLFVGILIIILVQQLVAFGATVFNELVYR